MYRTNVAFLMRFLFDVAVYFLDDTYAQNSARYIAANKEVNQETVDTTFSAFVKLFYVLSFGRLVLLLISIKYLKITKVYCYYQLLIWLVIEVGLPYDSGELRMSWLHVNLLIFFILDYFHFYPTAICIMLL